ncbi:MAG: leucyl/phenylalanyl-tRNA--protein transferase, partial [Betaproteobacteria bacterium]|nr:leucyl/phenylalanyl-tRNA--protein transferase [Betaproteobacteria bacterium]
MQPPLLIQLSADDPLPSPHTAWGEHSPAPGLLAIGGGLSVPRLLQAYSQGCFPWY